MLTRLHANATTMPKTRASIQVSPRTIAELAAEHGVHKTTIRRWKSRATTTVCAHLPHRIQTRFDATEEEIVADLAQAAGPRAR